MSIARGVLRYFTGAIDGDLASTATAVDVTPVMPLNLIRFGFTNTNSTATGTSLVITLRKRDVYGTGSWTTLATLSPSATVAQGKVLAMDLQNTAADGSADGIDKVNPGEQVQAIVTTAGATNADGQLFIMGYELPFQRTSGDSTEDRLANVTIVDES